MRRVLIADPNTPFATVVAEALQRMGGYKVALTASGPEALKACAELRPTLAVVDVDLPECNPFALIGQMREAVPGLPVVRNGYMYPNDKPGLGIDFDEKLAAKYPCKEEVDWWTQPRLPDGSPARP